MQPDMSRHMHTSQLLIAEQDATDTDLFHDVQNVGTADGSQVACPHLMWHNLDLHGERSAQLTT